MLDLARCCSSELERGEAARASRQNRGATPGALHAAKPMGKLPKAPRSAHAWQCKHPPRQASLPCGTLPQALAAFAAALAADAACMPALLGCAAVYKDSGLLADALASLEKALAVLDPAAQAAEAAAAAAPGPAVADSPAAAGAPCDADSVRHAMAVVLTDLGGPAATRADQMVFWSTQHIVRHAFLHAAATACPPPDVRWPSLAAPRTGTQRKVAGQEGWLKHYLQAVETCPSYAPAHYNLGAPLLLLLCGHCCRAGLLGSAGWPIPDSASRVPAAPRRLAFHVAS